jgi:hypothetical protein
MRHCRNWSPTLTSRSHWQLVPIRVPLGPVWGTCVDRGVGTLTGVRFTFLVELRERARVVLMVLLLVSVLQLVLVPELWECCRGSYRCHQLSTLSKCAHY